ncbi:hypothetical protein LSUCC0031_10535 [Rhodobacterales bacterium LSUCC0031]|nr:hypothetical protein [Rhodobacterales bacterium LSUCC0031]
MDQTIGGRRLGSDVTVNFALFLSPEGIALAHRQDAGHWAFIAEVPFAEADLVKRMADLKAIIGRRGGTDTPVLLVLPDDQILYTSLTAPTHDVALVQERIAAGLDGLTPYAVRDLVYDWHAVEQDRIKLAVVARDTLDEATAFAVEHGFSVAGFAAMPPLERFPGMPIFGDADAAIGAATTDLRFGPDLWVAPTVAPEKATDLAPGIAQQADADQSVVAAPDTVNAYTLIGARETGLDATVPPLDQPSGKGGDTTPAETLGETPAANDAETQAAKPKKKAIAQGSSATAEGLSEGASDLAPAPQSGQGESALTIAPEIAPSVSPEPIAQTPSAPVADDAAPPLPEVESEETDTAGAASQSTTDAAGGDSGDAGADAKAPPENRMETDLKGALADFLDPMFTHAITPIAQGDDVPTAPGDDVPTAPIGATAEPVTPASSEAALTAAAPSVARGKIPRPAADGRKLTAAKPQVAAAPPRAPAIGPLSDGDVARADAPTSKNTAEAPDASAAAQDRPIFGFSAKRRPTANSAKRAAKAAADEARGVAGKILAETRSRLGLGAAPASDTPPRHPDVANVMPRPIAAADTRPGAAFVAQLARVRDASKARATSEIATPITNAVPAAPIAPKAALRDSTPAKDVMPPATSPAGKPEAAVRQPPSKGAAAVAATLMNRRASTANAPTRTADDALASGLLARKPTQAPGPSLRTGLVLTLALLFVLILIAIWSVVFLPDSPMARLFGAGNNSQIAQSEGDAPARQDAAAQPASPIAEVTPASATANNVDPEALADGETEGEIALASAAPAPVAPPPAIPVARLPEIDADLELPPLPPIEEAQLPSIAEAEALYAAERIWPRPPERPFFSPFTLTDDIYIASIDPEVASFDAVALSDPRINLREVLRPVPVPPAFGARIVRDARGLVRPTPEGVLTPEGAFVILGQPVVAARTRPREIAPIAEAPSTLNVQDAILSTIQPRQRPQNLDETRERQLLGGLSRTELAAMRPTLRPVSAQESAARASLFAQPEATTPASAAPVAPVIGGTERAVAASRVPTARPANFATTVAAATPRQTQGATVTATAFAPAPTIPSNADVARAATSRNEIRLRDINLIGVTGTSSNRSALVRLSSGRFVRVSVGDRLDGGRVAAIGATSLQYVVNGRNITLEIPG